MADALVLRLWVSFFLGVSKWGKHFIMRFLRHFGLSALQFPLPVFFRFLFFIFFVFCLPFSCCAFFPRGQFLFSTQAAFSLFFSGLWSANRGRESGIPTKNTSKNSNKTGESLTAGIPR